MHLIDMVQSTGLLYMLPCSRRKSDYSIAKNVHPISANKLTRDVQLVRIIIEKLEKAVKVLNNSSNMPCRYVHN